jgi:hypothetical protein
MHHACFTLIALCFVYTLWHFYAFSRTNLITRCHSASSLFSAIFVFQKSYTGNILRIGQNKNQSSYLPDTKTESKGETEGAIGQPHHRVARATPWPRHHVVWTPGPPPDIVLPPINSLRRENPKGTNTFPWNILQATAVIVSRSGGPRSSSRHPAGEGNHHWRPSSSPCQSLEYAWLVYLGLRVHSSS